MSDEDVSSRHLEFQALPEPGERFKLEKVLATGSYGEIHLATDTENGDNKVAIKIIENINENLEEVEEEHWVLTEFHMHDNFPFHIGTFLKRFGNSDEHQIWFVMEYITHGTVAELARAYKKKNEKMPEDLIAYILREIIKAVQDLHQIHVMYRDLKGMNVLLTDEGKVKLIDFGQCGHLDATMSKRNTAVGTPYWMAPEVIECEQNPSQVYDIRCDVWALGITAIELGDGEPPNADVHPIRALLQIVRNPPPTLKRSSDWSADYIDFVSECLVKTPDHRPLMLEVVEHPFVISVPEDTTEVRKKLMSEHARLMGSDYKADQPQTAIARHGFLKTDHRSKAKKMITDDLASLQMFNDELVLECLHDRWKEGKIYTWVADVLISINPFSNRCSYDEDIQVKYKSKSRSQNDPHIFAIADHAHQDMMHHKEHQTIVLSGESGSGKTFNFHQLVSQLCHIGYSNPGLVDKIKKVCVVLDAFGNAVTQLNADSTRHARYFDITFSKTGKVSGALIWLMMLDKHRVTERVRGESNFHMFYYLYDGLSQSSRLSRYGLKLGRKYFYLAKHPFDNEVSNALKFTNVEEALQVIGLTDEEVHSVYLVLASILILGNIDFTGDQEATVVDMEPITEVCRLLDIEEKKLVWAFCNSVVVQPNQTVNQVKKTQYEAELSRDALARLMYSRLVDFLVNLINMKLSITRLVFGDPYAIGVLDMFGFEANDHNTLDNMLVNLANEQVQYYYNQSIFNWEMQDYSEEGIPVKNFTFPDNRHILELFLNKTNGILVILEDISRKTDGSDSTLANKLKQNENKKQLQPVSDFTFTIAHYVGRVKYDFNGAVVKNRDSVTADLIQTLRQSTNDHIRGMFTNKLTKTGNLTMEMEEKQKKKEAGTKEEGLAAQKKGLRRFNTKSKGRMSQTRQIQTYGTNFRYSLIELLYKLTNSKPHFVRCVRSNMDSSSTVFDLDMVKHQVKYHAICDTIRIRQQGFSHRIPYQEFLRRYKFLAFKFDETVDMTKDNARLLLVRLKMEGWAIGKDKVFLKFYTEEFLSRLYESSVKKIVKIQAVMREYIERKKKKAWKLKAPKAEKDGNIQEVKDLQENPEIANKIKAREKFGEKTIETEAVRYVQYYYRKWKMRTMFQQINIYRADKQKHLVHFSQQVHLYGQEMQVKQKRLNDRLDLCTVRNEVPGTHKSIMSREKSPSPKLPLDHLINAYFDTTFLCDPSRVKKGRQEDDNWEDPFKSQAAASARAANMGIEDENKLGGKMDHGAESVHSDVTLKTAIFNKDQNSNEHSNRNRSPTPIGSSAYNRFGGSSSSKPPSNYNQFVGNSNTKSPTTAYNQFSGSYLKSPGSKPMVVVNSWRERHHNGYSSAVEEVDQGTHDFRKNLKRTNRSAIQEMEERAATTGGSEGGANFQEEAGEGEREGATALSRSSSTSQHNFQGILRKTNYSRQSMEREEHGYSDDDNSADQDYSNQSYDNQGYADQGYSNVDGCKSPIFYEVTEEAML